ncbi:hypothetical protein PPYR_12298 [Photinus pyralis]|uniref:Uncharacterized protein n=1 Tax=Photinus pyralis TaxID=7054 RepID=A0A5N4ADT9_PHOPY|nr:hypothetical protein PPYR_12298 [Photinus pyralis]
MNINIMFVKFYNKNLKQSERKNPKVTKNQQHESVFDPKLSSAHHKFLLIMTIEAISVCFFMVFGVPQKQVCECIENVYIRTRKLLLFIQKEFQTKLFHLPRK